MFCPECRAEYREGFYECSDCRVPLVDHLPEPEKIDLGVLIQTGIYDPIAIALVQSLLREAGVPFLATDESITGRQQGGNVIGWWTVRVPAGREAEAREIIESIENSG